MSRETDVDFEIAVIGGGPAGVAAAKRAVAANKSVCLVEKADLGGTCLNWGCIPTKFLLGGTAPVEEFEAQARMKAVHGEVRADLAALQARKDRLVAATRKAVAKELEKLGVTLLYGAARFSGPQTFEIEGPDDGRSVGFGRCILATGSVTTVVPSMRPDGECVLDSDLLLGLTEVPESLIIVGGGVIGLEMGQIFERLGTKITVVEALDRLIPWEDAEVSEEMARICKRRKWTLKLGARVKSLRTSENQAELVLESGETLHAAKALVCIGRRPATDGLCAEKAGIVLNPRGFTQVDESLRASAAVYAVGDVNGRAMLAHAAEHQALFAVDHALGKITASYADEALPSCIYGSPETLRVGRMAHELEAAGLPARVSRFALAANPIAQAHASTQGFVKVVWSNGRIAGVTAIGHHVTSLATAAVLLVRHAYTREDVEGIIFPHPSLDEALKEACLADS